MPPRCRFFRVFAGSSCLLLGLWLGPAQAQTEASEAPPAPGELQQEPAEIDPALLERLDSIIGHESVALPDTAKSRELLRGILARPEFSSEGFDAAGPSPIERFFDWLQRLLSRSGIQGTSTTVLVLTLLLILAVSYLVFRLIWELLQRRAARSTVKIEARPEDMGIEALLASAEHAAGSGDFRTAIRWRFLALLKQLNLPSSMLMTNSQLTRMVSRTHGGSAARSFSGAARGFEDAWYGGMNYSRENYEELAALAAQTCAAWAAQQSTASGGAR